jgi:hypothetical protein
VNAVIINNHSGDDDQPEAFPLQSASPSFQTHRRSRFNGAALESQPNELHAGRIVEDQHAARRIHIPDIRHDSEGEDNRGLQIGGMSELE